MHRRLLLIGALLIGVCAGPTRAGATPEGPPIRTSIWSTLRSTVAVPELGESVLVEGRLHILSGLVTGDRVDVNANVADTRAIGLSSGHTYGVTGADSATLTAASNGGAIAWQPGFALTPEGPPIRLALELSYDEVGRLSGVRELHATPGDGSHD